MEFKIYGKIEAYKNQMDTHNLISNFSYNYNGQIIVIKAARQIYGKTQFCIAELLRHCINKEKSDCVFVSPTYSQALENYKKIVYSSVSTIIDKADQTTLNILFANGSRIRMFSAAQKQNLRGVTVKDLLIIDEAAFINDNVWYEILLPTTVVHKPLVIMVSTPYFKSGFFYDNFCANNIVLDWIDTYPEILSKNREFLDKQKALMPETNFKTEFLGQWLEIDDNSLFKLENNLINNLSNKPTKYVGIDWGSGNGGDFTCMVGLDEDLNQSLYYIDNELGSVESIEKISEILKPLKATIICEANSIGAVYIGMLKSKGINIKTFITTNSSKRRIVENLITATQRGTIKLLDDLEIIKQFSNLELKKTENNLITYNAKNGYHDDIVIATALSLSGVNSGNYNLNFI